MIKKNINSILGDGWRAWSKILNTLILPQMVPPENFPYSYCLIRFVNLYFSFLTKFCNFCIKVLWGEPAISLHSHHVSLVQWNTRLLPVMRDPGSNPQGGTYVKLGFSCYYCLATLVPQRDWSFLWPCLRRASSQTITRPSCQQCDNPTWSRTAHLSRFHACCRSFFRLHNRHSGCWGEPCGESAISLYLHHVWLVQWITHLHPVMRDLGSNPQGGNCVKPGFSCWHCLATVLTFISKIIVFIIVKIIHDFYITWAKRFWIVTDLRKPSSCGVPWDFGSHCYKQLFLSCPGAINSFLKLHGKCRQISRKIAKICLLLPGGYM